MPELPEVTTVINTLKKTIVLKRIVNVTINYEKILKNINKKTFVTLCKNQIIFDIKRLGKNIILVLSNYYLIVHLRMEGKFYYVDNKTKINYKHALAIFDLSDKNYLIFYDTRRFGTFYFYSKEKEIKNLTVLQKIGLEPWDKRLTTKYFYEKIKNRNIKIKTLLLRQDIIAGIGNIYADEILHKSNISPLRSCKYINKSECSTIIKNTKSILRNAISLGGTTVFSYNSANGISGKFQQKLQVYNKSGKLCNNCNIARINKIKLNGRGTHYCENCQR